MKSRKSFVRNFLSVLTIMTIATVQSMAQSPAYPEFKNEKFNVDIPTIDKVVKVTTNGVNIRKEPNAKSPRLVSQYDASEECMDCPANIVWLNRTLKKNEEAASPSTEDVFPLVEETGDWYKIRIDTYRLNYLNTPAYIMKKFCKIVQRRPILLPAPEWLSIAISNSPKYAGLCVQIYLDDFNGVSEMRLGKYTNGMFVFPYSINFEIANDKKIRFAQRENYTYISIDESMSPYDNTNISKFVADKYLDLFMNNLDKMNKNTLSVYYGVEGDDNWQSMEIYKGE